MARKESDNAAGAARPSLTRGDANLATVTRALTMLVAVANDGPLGITQMTQKLGYPKAVAHRLAATMVASGFLEQEPETKRYRIGPQAFRVGQAFDVAVFANRMTEELLRQIALEHGYSTYVGVLDDTDVLIVGAYQGRSAVRVDSAVKGDKRAAYSTAVGKALMARLPPARMREMVNRLRLAPQTERTIVDKAKLLAEIELTRKRGFGLSDQESLPEVNSVGVALHGLDQHNPIAISVSIPSFMFTEEKMDELATLMRTTAAEIERRIERAKAIG